MALDKNALKTTLEGIFSKKNSAAEAAQQIADAIDTYVKTATVTVTALPKEIQVEGSATAQMNLSAISLTGGDSTHTGGLS